MGRAVLIDVCCERCGATFGSPQLDEFQKVRFGELARSSTVFEVMRPLRRETDLDRGDAKCVALHITRRKGVCHRCHYPLSIGADQECPHCRALNFDW